MKKPKKLDRILLHNKVGRIFEADVIKVTVKNIFGIDDSGNTICVDIPYDKEYKWSVINGPQNI
tara:strand:- start:74 stop:265 length:192 start_codon:yes stop_codon:yes gene_type:complete